jgi:hypothetical protein
MPTVTYSQRSTLPDRVRILVGRLQTGWTLIDAEPDPTRKVRLEDHLIGLLRDYEAACDQEIVGDAEVAT